MSERSITSFYSIKLYHETMTKLRSFFLDKGYLEIDAQSQMQILAACEDPKTVASYSMQGARWPLPQTGQMWLEYALLKNPELPGVFCLTTSYRDEPYIINPTRHLRLFPLFEFESAGDMDALQDILKELFEYLGFGSSEYFKEGNYIDVAVRYGTKTLEADHEASIQYDYSHVFFLKNFPYYSHPFFNMRRNGSVAKKIDSILYGMETVGSAERSCNVDEMWEDFHTSSDGEYKQLLFEKFGEDRVIKELKEYLSLDFFPRCGGGIGINRLLRGLVLHQEQADITPFIPASKIQQTQL